ncbi:homeobox domain-containing protein [Microdochium nivale]|nr:homeobox domain-containing protein [Microdochium nivale]
MDANIISAASPSGTGPANSPSNLSQGHPMIPSKHKTVSTGRRTAPRLPQAAVQILEAWLVEHRDTPYVSALEQDQLKASTGLRRSQIKTWLANARKRRRIDTLVRPCLSPSSADHQQKHPQLFFPGEQPRGSRSPGEPSHYNTTFWPQFAGLDPFERWLLTGPEHEAATAKSITEALKHDKNQKDASSSRVPGATSLSRCTTSPIFPPKDKPIRLLRSQCSWPSSLDIRSYAANRYSDTSDHWKPNNPEAGIGHARGATAGEGAKSVDWRTPSKPARRHRRSEPSLAGASVRSLQRVVTVGGGGGSVHHNTSITAAKRRFQCTFCTDAFVKRHDWQRHEKSQHLALEWWTCCPDDGLASTHVDPETAAASCVFCGLQDPDRRHLDDVHGLGTCAARPEAERTFYRKDHLRQHLRLMHGDCAFAPAMEGWRTELVELKSRCGFCGVDFETWPARVSHLASHFRAGVTMDRWQGDWGLEPGVAASLERATLPADRVVAPLPHSPSAASAVAAQVASPPIPWPPSITGSPMAEPDSFSYFDASSGVFPLAGLSAAALAPSIMSDASGLPWDFSFADLETLPSASVLDRWDDYSFSAASAMDFLGGASNLPPLQEHPYLYNNDMMPPPLNTPPFVHEGMGTPMMADGYDGYDGPASALLFDFGGIGHGQPQQREQDLTIEDFLGVPPYAFSGVAADNSPAAAATTITTFAGTDDVTAMAPQDIVGEGSLSSLGVLDVGISQWPELEYDGDDDAGNLRN